MSSTLARLTVVAIAGTVAGIPVAVFELHAAQATPSAPAGTQAPHQTTSGARAQRPATKGSRAMSAPAQMPRRPAIKAPDRFTPTAGPRGSELESTAPGQATSGAAAPSAARGGSGASVRPALTAPPATVSAGVQRARHGARSVRTLLGETLSGARATAQSSAGTAGGVDLGAKVPSAATAPVAEARDEARSLVGHLAQEGEKQLAAISPLG